MKPQILAILHAAQRGWNYLVGWIDPANEKFNTRTRFKLAMLSFAVLTVVFIVSFTQAVKSADVERTSLFLDFAKHISYVLGAVVASYVGMESVFPSIGGYGWRGRGHPHHIHEHSGRKDDGRSPVHPGNDDAQVD